MITLCIKDNNDKILNYIMEKLIPLKNKNLIIRKKSFRLYNNLILHYRGNDFNGFYNTIANSIYSCIIHFYEPMVINRFLQMNYYYFNEFEKNLILDEYGKITIKSNNKSFLLFPILDYIKSSRNIYLEGFVNFRLHNYISNVQNLVEQSVNQFVVNKEYNKYVELLKNYVLSKPCEKIIVNLIYINSEGILLDENENYLDLKSFTSPYLSDVSFSNNDYVINTLIGLLPKKIIIHLISEKDQFINTIDLIFNNRVQYCTNCNLCSAYKILNNK